MQRRVVVTGMGVVCPLGNTTKFVWENLLAGKCGIDKITAPGFQNLPCKIAGQVPRGDGEGQLQIEKYVSKNYLKTMAPATSLSLVVAEEALSDANWKPEDNYLRERTGVAIGMGMVDLQDVCDSNEALQKGYNKVSPYFIPRILPNMAAGQISIKYGFRGPNHAVSTACATGAHSIGDGFRFIKSNDADVMICGGAEACINPISIAGFCRLRALSTKYNDNPKEASRPFDKNRDGFVMGEGAAALVLEELEHAKKRGAKIYAEILGYGLSGDASHMTAPREDGSGAILSMERALNEAGVKTENVTYVNAHATSTPIGDVIESKAIFSLFGRNIDKLSISSTKGSHGHLLGAAGNIEALFTVLSCYEGWIPHILNLEDISDVTPLDYVMNQKRKWDCVNRKIALKNSFGFGGTNATLCIAEIS